MKYTLAALSLILSSTAAMAQSTPVGLWKTFDESTKAEKSLVRISEAGGVVTGKVGLSEVAQAFVTLGDPEAHVKILVEPGR